MLNADFYKVIDTELEKIIADPKNAEHFEKLKQPNQKKSHAFLIWFLNFYGEYYSVKNLITDGPNDNSCDIIFPRKNSFGEDVYYVVQSKWNTIGKIHEKNDSSDVKKALADFSTILEDGITKFPNNKFKDQYRKLMKHIRNNKEVRFIFLSLSEYNDDVNDVVSGFKTGNGTDILFLDINNIKKDYIEREYKDNSLNNPLEYYYDPYESEITLNIERFGNHDCIDLNDLDLHSYVFIITPKTIHELFKKYRTGLFNKNVRNPLKNSEHNQKIEETLKTCPNRFWYYNNGITAITKNAGKLNNKISQLITLNGLQVINGAQTVYSIYDAYDKANKSRREVLDKNVKILFRLIESSDEPLNLEITRYTNSQNKILSSDFMANDEIQIRLQNESFNGTFWYERKRGEFVNNPEGVRIIDSRLIARDYITFHLQKLQDALYNYNNVFKSHKEDKNGIYEKIFNENTTFKDILISYLVSVLVRGSLFRTYLKNTMNKTDQELLNLKDSDLNMTDRDIQELNHMLIPIIGLINPILIDYLSKKGKITNKNVSNYLLDLYEKDKHKFTDLILLSVVISLDRIYGDRETGKIHVNMDKIMNKECLYYFTEKENIEKIGLTEKEISILDNPKKTEPNLDNILNKNESNDQDSGVPKSEL
ncbi:AIPR family protein [Methanococcus maripaludis]|uniref:Abortive phage infection protein C-terminal domain-containing protein n=1 Tax=Methanococcus maripaludis (strain DSM 14266 / JCM 13030 / NBRC 101832 / S2 / LL) TaxID=267377 RepID=Q6LZZ2_METMP|nr:AIPR family protein [Methanococcus maripaludis]CAF30037.1 conserved hypothetical protein [Methanococcus maripaludis S2]